MAKPFSILRDKMSDKAKLRSNRELKRMLKIIENVGIYKNGPKSRASIADKGSTNQFQSCPGEMVSQSSGYNNRLLFQEYKSD
jgi:hypothetical protein